MPLYPLIGSTFLLFAFVLAARVLALAFGGAIGHDRVVHRPAGRRPRSRR
ncbi:hypothetical protein [Mobilicoccus caccae]|nr:hypothetical protein [Mobilicoccus caccae]